MLYLYVFKKAVAIDSKVIKIRAALQLLLKETMPVR